MNPVLLSLLVAVLSSTLLLPPAAALGFLLQRGHLGWRTRWLLSLPLSLPPLASGVLLLWLFSPLFPLGSTLQSWGLNPILTWYGCVFASLLVCLPLAIEASEAAWKHFPEDMALEARSLGARPAQMWLQVGLPQVRPGLVRAWGISFQRSLGEFGATLLVAGNIPGQTQTLPLALFEASESGHWSQAAQLMGMTLLLALASSFLVGRHSRS